MQWTGLLPHRDKDVLGLGATRVRFSNEPDADFDETSEIASELFYKIQLRRWLSLAPDFQYVHNPGGVASRRHPVVGTMRMIIGL